MQPTQQSPYDFILQNDANAKRPKTPAPNSTGSRIFIVLGGLVALLLIIIVGASLLRGGGGSDESLLKVLQLQQETVRIATTIARESSDPTVKNTALTAQLSIASDKSALTTALSGRGISFKEEQVLAGINQETDTRLTTAKAGGLYESTALLILSEHLNAYQAALSTAFEATSSEEVKNTISANFQAATVLVDRIEATEL